LLIFWGIAIASAPLAQADTSYLCLSMIAHQ
jgi:hypothetical protein